MMRGTTSTSSYKQFGAEKPAAVVFYDVWMVALAKDFDLDQHLVDAQAIRRALPAAPISPLPSFAIPSTAFIALSAVSASVVMAVD